MLLRLLLLLILFWMFARAFWSLIEGVVRGVTGPAPQSGGRSGHVPVSVKMAPCPKCGIYVVPGKAISMTTGAHVLHFCSDTCRAAYTSR